MGDIAERTFATLEQQGVIVPAKRGRGGRPSVYAIASIVPAYLAHISQQRPTSDRDARSRRDLSQAQLNELRLERERAQLVPRDEVILAGQAFTKAWAAKVRALPHRLMQIGVISREDAAKVDHICREVLTEISRWQTIEDAERAVKHPEVA